jgi:ABC-type uncharacterized transport system involved in gliding motility auxiliary subunit
LILLEPGVDPLLGGILASFGVKANDDLVVDPNAASRALGFGADAPLVRKLEPTRSPIPSRDRLCRSTCCGPSIR